MLSSWRIKYNLFLSSHADLHFIVNGGSVLLFSACWYILCSFLTQAFVLSFISLTCIDHISALNSQIDCTVPNSIYNWTATENIRKYLSSTDGQACTELWSPHHGPRDTMQDVRWLEHMCRTQICDLFKLSCTKLTNKHEPSMLFLIHPHFSFSASNFAAFSLCNKDSTIITKKCEKICSFKK